MGKTESYYQRVMEVLRTITSMGDYAIKFIGDNVHVVEDMGEPFYYAIEAKTIAVFPFMYDYQNPMPEGLVKLEEMAETWRKKQEEWEMRNKLFSALNKLSQEERNAIYSYYLLERKLLNLIGNCSEPLSGRRIHELLAENASSLLPGEVASCIWKLARDGKLSVRTDLKVVRLPTH